MLAGAEVYGAIGFSLIKDRRERGALVGAVAERLRLAVATRAPVIGLTGFDEDGDRGLLRDMGGGHERKMTEGR
jgi:hypothetical protein